MNTPTAFVARNNLDGWPEQIAATVAVYRDPISGHYSARAVGIYPTEQIVFRLMQDEKLELRQRRSGVMGVVSVKADEQSWLNIPEAFKGTWEDMLLRCDQRTLIRGIIRLLRATYRDGPDGGPDMAA